MMNTQLINKLKAIGYRNIDDHGRLLTVTKGQDDVENGKSLQVLSIDTKEKLFEVYIKYDGLNVFVIRKQHYDDIQDLALTLLKNRIVARSLSS